MFQLRKIVTCCAFIVGLGGAAFAQAPNSAATSGSAPLAVPNAATQGSSCPIYIGPTVYVVDAHDKLAAVDLGSKAVRIIGSAGTLLTDIAFNPKNHQLYGLSFSALYSVNKTTGRATFIGNLGVSDANALVFNKSGEAFSAGVNSGQLYSINITSGKASVIGSMGGYKSAGDLTFYNGALVLTGYKGTGSIGTSTPNYLVTINEKTGAVVGTPVLLATKEIFGLVSTGHDELYGFGLVGTNTAAPALYQFFPTAAAGKRDALLEALAGSGLGQIYGAAYDGNYQP